MMLKNLLPGKKNWMSYNLIVQTQAILSARAAFEWYENIRIGLGFELLEEIESCYEKIIYNPNNYTYINKRYRRIRTKGFPYLIIYEVEDKSVFVYNVVHAKQKKGLTLLYPSQKTKFP